MMTQKSKPLIQFVLQNAIFCLITLLISFGLKYHYSTAGSDELSWILAPTASVVAHISGIGFENEARTGFVNHQHRVIIAPSCAGVNFLIIVFCMAVFYGIHQLNSRSIKLLWMIFSGMSAYLLTIGVNAVRIILSIYLYNLDIYWGWITPQRLHRLEGVVIYFFFLCLFYMIINKGMHRVLGRISEIQKIELVKKFSAFEYRRWVCALLIPLFWYVLITLGIPLANAAYRGNPARFAEHCAMVVFGCLIVVVTVYLMQMGWRWVKGRRIRFI
jgi:exosortase K